MISVDCPRCEAQGDFDFSPEAIAAQVEGIYIAPSLKVGSAVYQERLAACSRCDSLREKVLCAHCGCFVLFRARPRKSYCPHPAEDKWRI